MSHPSANQKEGGDSSLDHTALALFSIIFLTGLCYELSNNTLYSDMCYHQAQKVSNSDKEKTFVTTVSPRQSPQQLHEDPENLGINQLKIVVS